MEILGLVIDTLYMTISLTEEKIQRVIKLCLELHKYSKVIGLLSSPVQTYSIEVFTGTSNINIKHTEILPNTSHLKQLRQNRTSLVDRKSENIKWQEIKTSGTSFGD